MKKSIRFRVLCVKNNTPIKRLISFSSVCKTNKQILKMDPEDLPKPESTFTAFSESADSKPSSESNVAINRNKTTIKTKTAKPGFRFKDQRYPGSQRDDQYINEKLAMITSPTTNLPTLKHVEKKFSGRARLYIGNLPPKITEEEIKSLFGKYGETDEIFINHTKGFGFIKMDYCVNAERAKNELTRYNLQGRSLVIRNAHPAAIRVKNIPSTVSNELLHLAFSIFGEIEFAYIVVDDRGKSTGEGVVEYLRKPAALLAMKRCTEGCYFLTSSLKPVIVENYEPPMDTTGYPEQMLKKSQEYYREREIGPRFAKPGSFQFQYAERWKTLHQKYQEKAAAIKAEKFFDEQKLEGEMLSVQYDHETEQLKEMLRIREMDRKRFKQDWEMRQRQLEEQCLRERQKFGEESGSRLQDSLFIQANQLNNLLDHEEQQLQEQWRIAEYSGGAPFSSKRIDMGQEPSSTSQCWGNPGADHLNHNYRPMNKRPRH